jgi:hypothetical protein
MDVSPVRKASFAAFDFAIYTILLTPPVKVTPVAQSSSRVAFSVTYEGDFAGVSHIVEYYLVTPAGVELTTKLPSYSGSLRYVWPVLADDGNTQSSISVKGNTVSVSQNGGKTTQTFTARGVQREVLKKR